MQNNISEPADSESLRRLALSEWDSEGGAGPQGSQEQSHAPLIPDTDTVQLRIRIIALENLVIAILAAGNEQQLSLAGEMADMISPRQGSTPHPLTIKAASHMVDLTERSKHFRAERSI